MLTNRGGYTLLEVLVATGITALIGMGTVGMIVGSMSCYDKVTVQAYTNTDAVMAMQRIVTDIREAKSINIIADGNRLRVIFPERLAEGYYNRHEPDMAHQIDYYLSDETGVPGHSGNILWRGKNNSNRKPLKRGISSISFEPDTSRSVKITIVAEGKTAGEPERTELTQRVVYLRNY